MLSLAHFGFVVTNLEKSLAFYQGLLGLELIGTTEREGEDISRIVGLPGVRLKAAFLRFPPDGPSMELIQYLSPEGNPVDTLPCNAGNGHIAFRTEAIHTVHAELVAKGIRLKGEPVKIESGINKGGWAIYFQDPDGISLELWQPPARGLLAKTRP